MATNVNVAVAHLLPVLLGLADIISPLPMTFNEGNCNSQLLNPIATSIADACGPCITALATFRVNGTVQLDQCSTCINDLVQIAAGCRSEIESTIVVTTTTDSTSTEEDGPKDHPQAILEARLGCTRNLDPNHVCNTTIPSLVVANLPVVTLEARIGCARNVIPAGPLSLHSKNGAHVCDEGTSSLGLIGRTAAPIPMPTAEVLEARDVSLDAGLAEQEGCAGELLLVRGEYICKETFPDMLTTTSPPSTPTLVPRVGCARALITNGGPDRGINHVCDTHIRSIPRLTGRAEATSIPSSPTPVAEGTEITARGENIKRSGAPGLKTQMLGGAVCVALLGSMILL